MSKFRPLFDRVLITRSAAENRSPGGIVLPDNAKEKPARGEVLAVGPGRVLDDGTRLAMSVKVGDIVWFAKYTGSELTLNGQDVLVLREDEILGVQERVA